MNHIDFDKLVERETKRMKDVMCTKSADYSADDDKLFNFKLAAEVDGVSPIEALRGMWLKHRTSLRQGLDELMDGKCRSEAWWIEKLTDDRNYSMLLQGLLTEKYFTEDLCPEEVSKFTIRKAQDPNRGWYIILTSSAGTINPRFLQKDLEIHTGTGWTGVEAYGSAPGYYDNKIHAKSYIRMYESKSFVCPEGWEIKFQDGLGDYDCGWWVRTCKTDDCLHKDLTVKRGTGWTTIHGYGEAPGYWPTKEDAEVALAAYLERQKC